MIKAAIFIFAILNFSSAFAKMYKAPNLKIKKQIPQYKIKKVKNYDKFSELNYKINTRPLRQRNIASQKRGGRIPSSKTQSFHNNHLENWVWKRK